MLRFLGKAALQLMLAAMLAMVGVEAQAQVAVDALNADQIHAGELDRKSVV